ncbi:unnamed protein product, partial [Pocillopora meandrina]
GYYHSKVNRYSNSNSTFQLIRLKTSGDISLNPGPSTARSKCQKCSRTIASKDLRVAHLNVCSLRKKMDELRCMASPPLLSANTSKLHSVFEMFNMENVIQEATRQTITSSSLIDLIVTTRKDLVSATGVFPLGISDHNLIYASIRLKNKRPPPIIVKTRDYKRMDIRSFRDDIESAPFHIASIFDDPDD